jgi:hypothetical protein
MPGRTSTEGSKLLDIINTGSQNVTNLYAYVDTEAKEPERPYKSDNATKYSVGGVIKLKNETYPEYYFAGRLEWNWTEELSNMVKTSVSSPAAWGFIKNTSYEYNWLLGKNSTTGFCNDTDAQFALSDYKDNGTQSTRAPTTYNIDYQGGDAKWGYFNVRRFTAPVNASCVAAYYDCSKIYIYKYDRRTTPNDFTTCSNATSLQTSYLTPGEVHTLTLDVFMPYGVPNGNLNTATFTVYAYTA